jgi:hypothetical protein
MDTNLGEVESDHPKPGTPKPFLVSPANEWEPMISPDGRWLAYYSNDSGRYEVYVRPFPGPGGHWPNLDRIRNPPSLVEEGARIILP